MIPEIGLKGFYTFKKPWVAKEGIAYTCLAIRSFSDVLKLGTDPYYTYYKSVGLEDGKDITGTSEKFSYAKEVANSVNIITLEGGDGSVMYVPSSYILKMPDITLVPYSRVILSVDLGALPDSLDLSSIKEDVASLVAARMNINPTVEIGTVPVENNPTQIKHAELEATRLGQPMELRPNTHMLLDREQQRVSDLTKANVALIQFIQSKGLIEQVL